MKPEYLVYSNPNNEADFYYKDKVLHRECGPAIVIFDDKEKYSDLKDKKLYKKTDKAVVPDKKESFCFEGPKGKLEYTTKIFSPEYSLYYLDGIEHREKEFNAMILEKELSLKHAATQPYGKKVKI